MASSQRLWEAFLVELGDWTKSAIDGWCWRMSMVDVDARDNFDVGREK